MNEKNMLKAAIKSTYDRKRDLEEMRKKSHLKANFAGYDKKIEIQEYIIKALREKQERTAKDLCDLTCEQLGRLVKNSYIEGYEDCKAGREPIEKQEREKPKPLTIEKLREMDEERVFVKFPEIEMYGLVSYLTDEDYCHDKDFEVVMITNALGGRNSYDEIISYGGTIYRHKPTADES